MATVTVIRHTRHYARTRNGAWVGAPTEQSAPRQVELESLKTWTIGDGWLEVIWPDGQVESVFSSRLGPGYPPEPMGPRLRELFGR